MDDVTEFSFRCRIAPHGGSSVPLRLSGPRGATLGTVRAALRAFDPDTGPDAELCCDGAPIADDAVLGLPPLLEGCTFAWRDRDPRSFAPSPPRGVLARAVGVGSSVTVAPGAGSVPMSHLQVVSGPGAGAATALGGRPVSVGRGMGADLMLADPDVSRRHLVVRPIGPTPRGIDEVGPGVVGLVSDVGSTNGTLLLRGDDPIRVAGDTVELRTGDRIRVGRCTLALRAVADEPALVTADGVGGLLVSRSAHVREKPADRLVRVPASEVLPPRQGFPWTPVLLPLVVAVPSALVWHQPWLLVVALASPLFAASQFVLDSRSRRRRAFRSRAERAEAERAGRARIQALTSGEQQELERWHPDLAEVGRIAGSRHAAGSPGQPRRALWRRTPQDEGWLSVRLGTGRRPSGIRVECEDRRSPVTRLWLDDAPITLDLGTFPTVGICGPREAARGLARSVLAQLAAHCSPRDLELDVRSDRYTSHGLHGVAPEGVGSPRGNWEWVGWLPHRTSATGSAAERPERRRVVVVDTTADPAEHAPAAATPLGHPADGGPSVVIHLGSSPSALPVGCDATVEIDPTGTSARLALRGEEPLDRWLPDLLAEAPAHDLATALAPCRDAGSGHGHRPARGHGHPHGDAALPQRVQLVDLLRREGVDPLDPAAIQAGWSADDGSCTAPVAVSDGVTWRVDLDGQGPHALVAGTTGAGKSQFLISFVAALAVTHPPEALTFVLVDYKGGSAFGEVAGLPHVTGMVTDLDPPSTLRLLDSLGAEVKRRERLLAARGAADLAAYRQLRGPGDEPLPRLVVVVDEFRVLVEEVPDFVPGLVRLAAVGRSLGLHLVLATQRPAGAVSTDIRANVNLRIALRVRDAADSLDVVECSDAAGLPPDRPGRAVVALPAAPPRLVQLATLLGRPRPRPASTTVIERLDRGGSSRPETSGSSAAELVGAVVRAWEESGGAPPRPAWLPALPATVPLSGLRPVAARRAADRLLVLGREDRVHAQSQPEWCWDPAGSGHLAVVGGPGSGRSTALRTVALAAAATGRPVHVLDAGGSLRSLARLPHVANVVAPDDPERCDRLLSALDRARRDGPGGTATAEGGCLLLVDGWESVQAAWSEPECVVLWDRLAGLLRETGSGAVRVVASGGRALVMGSAAASFAERVVLPFPDPADAVLAGAPAAPAATGPVVPGRAVHLGRGDVRTVQIAISDDDDEAFLLRQPVEAFSATVGRMVRVAALPRDLPLEDALSMPDHAAPDHPRPGHPGPDHPRPGHDTRHDTGHGSTRSTSADHGRPVIGCSPGPVTDSSGSLVRARLPVSRSGGSLVLGRAGGGRSTTLDVLQVVLTRRGLAVVRTGPDGDFGALELRLRARPDSVVLVDDADLIGAGAEDDLLLAHLQGTLSPGVPRSEGSSAMPRLVAVTTATDALGRYRGLVAELKSGRCGIVVGGVQPGDGEVFGVRLPSGRPTVPGRGLLVDRGRTATVQVATVQVATLQEATLQEATVDEASVRVPGAQVAWPSRRTGVQPVHEQPPDRSRRLVRAVT